MEIKKYRKELGITQEQMARVVGLAVPNYCKMENGKFKVFKNREQIAMDFMLEYNEYKQGLENLIKKYEKKFKKSC